MDWISVKDRLPEINVSVLISMIYDDVSFIAYRTETNWQCVFPEWGEVCGNGYFNGELKEEPESGIKVTHWMPLPEPPKKV